MPILKTFDDGDGRHALTDGNDESDVLHLVPTRIHPTRIPPNYVPRHAQEVAR